jgi:hypothetical protein
MNGRRDDQTAVCAQIDVQRLTHSAGLRIVRDMPAAARHGLEGRGCGPLRQHIVTTMSYVDDA